MTNRSTATPETVLRLFPPEGGDFPLIRQAGSVGNLYKSPTDSRRLSCNACTSRSQVRVLVEAKYLNCSSQRVGVGTSQTEDR